VSDAAAGSVGSVAGQIATLLAADVIGLAGSAVYASSSNRIGKHSCATDEGLQDTRIGDFVDGIVERIAVEHD
jgi:NADPH-dependent curcumin reductase CurA